MIAHVEWFLWFIFVRMLISFFPEIDYRFEKWLFFVYRICALLNVHFVSRVPSSPSSSASWWHPHLLHGGSTSHVKLFYHIVSYRHSVLWLDMSRHRQCAHCLLLSAITDWSWGSTLKATRLWLACVPTDNRDVWIADGSTFADRDPYNIFDLHMDGRFL